MPAGSLGYDQNGNQVTGTNNHGFLLALILGALQNLLGIGDGANSVSNLPYEADEQVLTNVQGGPGPTVIVYKKAGVVVKTRTLTYTGSGPNDVLVRTLDT